jgi:hypothetical protein
MLEPARTRTPTDEWLRLIADPEPPVQIHSDKDGRYHRKTVDGNYTACGDSIDHRHRQAHRIETYEGSLCMDGCFTMFELSLSQHINNKDKP